MSEETTEYTIPYTITLKHPIEVTKDRNLEKITFTRRLNGADMEKIPAGDTSKMVVGTFYPIIAGMTGESPALIKKLDWQTDLSECIAVVSSFLEPGQSGGELHT